MTISAARRADGILAAWERKDLDWLEDELSRADGSRPTGDAGERERMELLGCIAGQMRQELPHMRRAGEPSERAEACLRLLQHLAANRRVSRLAAL
jgi:hypothetical protein